MKSKGLETESCGYAAPPLRSVLTRPLSLLLCVAVQAYPNDAFDFLRTSFTVFFCYRLYYCFMRFLVPRCDEGFRMYDYGGRTPNQISEYVGSRLRTRMHLLALSDGFAREL